MMSPPTSHRCLSHSTLRSYGSPPDSVACAALCSAQRLYPICFHPTFSKARNDTPLLRQMKAIRCPRPCVYRSSPAARISCSANAQPRRSHIPATSSQIADRRSREFSNPLRYRGAAARSRPTHGSPARCLSAAPNNRVFDCNLTHCTRSATRS